jgi:VWFA-related protein
MKNMHRVRVSVAAPLVCLLGGGWMAATLSRAQEPVNSNTTIRSSVEEVVLDLLVRDSKGKAVKNLTADDVTVLEDGKPQKIKSFRLVAGHEARQEVVAAASAAAGGGKTVSAPLPGVNLICLVFQNLTPYNKKYATEAAQEFVKNQMQPNTWLAAFTLNSRLVPLHDFTTDRNLIFQLVGNINTAQGVDFMNVADAVITASPNITTIEQTSGGDPSKGVAPTVTTTSTGGEINTRAINDAGVSTDIGASRQRGDKASARREFGGIEGRRSMDQIEAMIAQLKTLPGRKSVLLLSPGLPTTGDSEAFDSLLKKANQANTTFYAIDINGLSENSNALASSTQLAHAAGVSATQAGNSTSAAVNMEKMRQGDYVDDAVRTTDQRATLRALSEGTGGFLIADTNDLRKSYNKILEDVATHYEVIYASSSEKEDGHLRTIEVKTSKAGISIESRTGYYAMPPLHGSTELTQSELTGLAALNVKTKPHAFPFRSSAFEFRPQASATQDAIAFELPAASLTATALPANKTHRLHVSLIALVKDSTGEVIDKFSQDSALEIPDDKLSALQQGTIPFTHAIDLAPGHYTIDTAIVDMEGKRASTDTLQLDTTAKKGVGLSSVMLVQRMETAKAVDPADPFVFAAGTAGRRIIPELGDNLRAGVKPYVFFVVYPDKGNPEKPKLQVEFLVDDKVIAKQLADLPAPDATGAIPMVVATATQPGKCQMRISAIQGTATAVQSLHYSVAAAN